MYFNSKGKESFTLAAPVSLKLMDLYVSYFVNKCFMGFKAAFEGNIYSMYVLSRNEILYLNSFYYVVSLNISQKRLKIICFKFKMTVIFGNCIFYL